MTGNLAQDIPSDSPISDSVLETMQQLKPLIGSWHGSGIGSFPTIESFHYRESLVILQRGDEPYLAYNQTTELVTPKGEFIKPGHWEAGVVIPQEDGTIEISNAQNSGRVEVLIGHLDFNDGLSIDLTSKLVQNDPRMVSSARIMSLKESQLHYKMSMITTMVGNLTHHLEATLDRV